MGIWDGWKVIYASNHTPAQWTPGTKHLLAWFRLTYSFSLDGGRGAETLGVGSSQAKAILQTAGIVTGEWRTYTLSETIVMHDNRREMTREAWGQFVKDFIECNVEKFLNEHLLKTINNQQWGFLAYRCDNKLHVTWLYLMETMQLDSVIERNNTATSEIFLKRKKKPFFFFQVCTGLSLQVTDVDVDTWHIPLVGCSVWLHKPLLSNPACNSVISPSIDAHNDWWQ